MVNEIFDRKKVKLHRDKAAKYIFEHSFLVDFVINDICARLNDFTTNFANGLLIGAYRGIAPKKLMQTGKINQLTSSDLSEKMLEGFSGPVTVCDDENLNFKPASFDIIIGCLNLHWINDVPATLFKIKALLKPTGIFIASFLGEETLKQLKQALIQAEINITGGAAPRISPYIDVKTIGALMQRTGFKKPIIDCDRLTANYSSVFSLADELSKMGESAAFYDKPKLLTKKILNEADKIYRNNSNNKNGINASFDIITITALA